MIILFVGWSFGRTPFPRRLYMYDMYGRTLLHRLACRSSLECRREAIPGRPRDFVVMRRTTPHLPGEPLEASRIAWTRDDARGVP
jgi:hypothetical protein